mmetsp:Transcript_33257/g.30200  ORF Transcript_33257/g.30200 Transcript_33257/m.30200 type:complete len:261 (+) Transcript_33257:917-1699(+)
MICKLLVAPSLIMACSPFHFLEPSTSGRTILSSKMTHFQLNLLLDIKVLSQLSNFHLNLTSLSHMTTMEEQLSGKDTMDNLLKERATESKSTIQLLPITKRAFSVFQLMVLLNTSILKMTLLKVLLRLRQILLVWLPQNPPNSLYMLSLITESNSLLSDKKVPLSLTLHPRIPLPLFPWTLPPLRLIPPMMARGCSSEEMMAKFVLLLSMGRLLMSRSHSPIKQELRSPQLEFPTMRISSLLPVITQRASASLMQPNTIN